MDGAVFARGLLAAMLLLDSAAVRAETPADDPIRMEAGEWDAEIRFPAQQPGQEDKRARGHQSNELRSGGMWMLNRFSVEGTPYQGTGLWGFDRLTGRYKGVWVDNNDRQIRIDDGRWNPATRVMQWNAGIIQADGTYLPLLMTERFEAERRLFRTVALTRKGEVPLVEIEFRRSLPQPAR